MGSVVNSLGSGKRFGCEFTYRVQEEARGIAHALSLARSFANGGRIVVLLGDNIFEYSIVEHVREYTEQNVGARVLLKEVGDPERFGIAALDETMIVEIEEKPALPKSNLAVVGCYMYDTQVFDIIDHITPSARRTRDYLRQQYLHFTGQLAYSVIRGRWADAGTFESSARGQRPAPEQ
jgi:glucose-1-phosphate thymidylyltransferase